MFNTMESIRFLWYDFLNFLMIQKFCYNFMVMFDFGNFWLLSYKKFELPKKYSGF